MNNYHIKNNTEQMQFEINFQDQISILVYRIHKGNIVLMHTEVPEELEGRGIASALATYAFQFAKENHLPVIVYCPFVKQWLIRHPEVLSQVVRE